MYALALNQIDLASFALPVAAAAAGHRAYSVTLRVASWAEWMNEGK